MGKAAKTRKFGAVSIIFNHLQDLLSIILPPKILTSTPQVKRVIGQRDARLKENKDKGEEGANKPKELVREA